MNEIDRSLIDPYQGKMKWLYQWTSSYQVPSTKFIWYPTFSVRIIQNTSVSVVKSSQQLTVTCRTIPTMHACLARTRMRATPPHITIFTTFQPPSTNCGTVVKVGYKEVLKILNIWKTTVFVLSATGQVVVDTVFSGQVVTAVCLLQEHRYAGRKIAWGRNYWKMQLE